MLKQRLTGAIILTSLAIVILPLLLTGTEKNRETVTTRIPAPPRIALNAITVEETTARMKQAERASEARLPQERVDEIDYADGEDFMLDRNQLPVSWSLQVGSFQHQENAISLRATLRAENYRAYILHAKTTTGEIWRTYVGPMVSKRALAELAASLEANLGLKGQAVRYRIEEDAGRPGG